MSYNLWEENVLKWSFEYYDKDDGEWVVVDITPTAVNSMVDPESDVAEMIGSYYNVTTYYTDGTTHHDHNHDTVSKLDSLWEHPNY